MNQYLQYQSKKIGTYFPNQRNHYTKQKHFQIKITVKSMSLNIKNQPKLFRILEYRQLSDLIFILFLTGDYLNLILTCKKIHIYLTSKVNETLWNIREKFQEAYSKYLPIRSHFIRSENFVKNKKQYKKIDVVIEFGISDTLSNNDIYTVSYSSKVRKNSYMRSIKKEQKYFWKYQFLPVKKGKQRSLWMYKQETKNHHSSDGIPYTCDIIPIGFNDIASISITYYCSLRGIIDPIDIHFYKIQSRKVNNLLETLDFKSISEMVCPLEKSCQWLNYQYYENPIDFQVQDIIKCYPSHFKVISLKISDMNVKNYRIEMQCTKNIKNANLLGHKINIHPYNSILSIQLKKKGCYDQKYRNIQMRQGDLIIIYMTQNQ